MAVRVCEAVGRPVPDVSVDPADAETGRLDRRHPPLERLGVAGSDRHVPETGLGRLGQLQRVALVVRIPPEVDGLALGCLLLHPERVDEEAEAPLRLRGEQLGVPDVREVARAHDPPPPGLAGRRGRRRERLPGAARASSPRAPRARGRRRAPRRPDPAGRRRRRRRRGRRRRPARSPDRRRSPARRSRRRRPCPPRGSRRTWPRSGGPSSTSSSTSRTAPSTRIAAAPLRLRLGREQVADEREGLRLGHRHHEHVAWLDRGHRGVHHQVVALAAADRPRGAGDARPGDDLT